MDFCWKVIVSIFDLVIFVSRGYAKPSLICNNITITSVNGSAIIVIS